MTKAKWFETRISGIKGYLKGRKVQLATGNNGVPLDPFWKARFEENGIVTITPIKRAEPDKIETKIIEKPVKKPVVKKLVEKKVKKTSDKKPKKATRKRGR